MWRGSRTLPPAQIEIAAQEPEKYSAALVFSTKYDPPASLFSLGARSEALDEQYFGLHHDLPPELIASELHGAMVWKRDDDGMWIALIRFDRQVEARLERLRGCGSGRVRRGACREPCGPQRL